MEDPNEPVGKAIRKEAAGEIRSWIRWALWGAGIGGVLVGGAGGALFGLSGLAIGALIGAVVGSLGAWFFYISATMLF